MPYAPSWLWWAWNANSGDTGGIVADNWQDVVWVKISKLSENGWNLKPWYI